MFYCNIKQIDFFIMITPIIKCRTPFCYQSLFKCCSCKGQSVTVNNIFYRFGRPLIIIIMKCKIEGFGIFLFCLKDLTMKKWHFEYLFLLPDFLV